ncbi:hypothetical protein MPSEU_000928500 [Mayamaea pseudoterrestris]|nr:hypothetical protein MPSEU_000928500 [Mayamaea pseudoterrestris]
MSNKTGCMCCAYGPLTTFPAIVSFFATILTYSAAFGCSLFTSGNNQASVGSWGLWTVEGRQINLELDATLYDYVCYSYAQVVPFGDPSAFLDAPMKAGRAFSAIAATLAGPLWVTIMMLCCVNFGNNRVIFKVISLWCVFVGVMILLELAGMASKFCKDQVQCKIGSAGILAIVSFFLWLLTALLVATMNQEPRALAGDASFDNQPKEVVVETKTRNPDGTVTVTTRKTITHADGSKEVIESSDIEATGVKM